MPPLRRPRLTPLALVFAAAFAAAMSVGWPAGFASEDDPAEPILPIPQPAPPADGRAKLGKTLFASRLLSRGNVRSCASCHDVESNGAESGKVSISAAGTPTRFNAPTVFNAAHNFRQHWEGEVRTPRDEVGLSIVNPEFMGESWSDLLGKLTADPALSRHFQTVFRRPVDQDGVLDALVAYEATLVTPDSRFDLWLRGDKAALTEKEQEGYRLFKSAGCAACHQGVNVGGNLFARAGVFQPLLDRPVKRMRVPSLRNVAVTAPYFDDGSAKTLDEAVRRMGEAQLGRQLTPPQIGSIVAFLETLTGRFEGQPLRPAR